MSSRFCVQLAQLGSDPKMSTWLALVWFPATWPWESGAERPQWKPRSVQMLLCVALNYSLQTWHMCHKLSDTRLIVKYQHLCHSNYFFLSLFEADFFSKSFTMMFEFKTADSKWSVALPGAEGLDDVCESTSDNLRWNCAAWKVNNHPWALDDMWMDISLNYVNVIQQWSKTLWNIHTYVMTCLSERRISSNCKWVVEDSKVSAWWA